MKTSIVAVIAALVMMLPQLVASQAAINVKDGTCTLIDVDGKYIPADKTRVTATYSEPNVVILKCSAKYDSETDTPAALWNYENFTDPLNGMQVPCEITVAGNSYETYDWFDVANKKGAQLTCKYKE